VPVLPIRTLGDPVLGKKTQLVDPLDPSLKALVDDMFETMIVARGVGLAAPQVGLSLRLAVINVTGGEDRSADLVLINPQILELTGEVEEEEGCLSVPEPDEHETPLRGKARRAVFCRARAQALDGSWFEVAGDGTLGKALQHEIDHLEGRLFIERLTFTSKALLSGKLKALRREYEQAHKARGRA
jgi:peptide deformylase